MARNVYSLRIAAFGALSPGTGVVGPIVPPGLIYVLRDVDAVFEAGTLPGTLAVKSAIGGFLTFLEVPVGAQNFSTQWRGRQVYQEGEQVGFESLAGAWDLQASGYQLTLP